MDEKELEELDRSGVGTGEVEGEPSKVLPGEFDSEKGVYAV